MNTARDAPSCQGPFPLMLLIGAAALSNLIGLAIVFDRASGLHLVFFVAVWLGWMLGQLGLLMIWAVLGPQRLRVQWPAALLTLLVLSLLSMAGLTIPLAPWSDTAVLHTAQYVFTLPLLFTIGQLPLWLLRLGAGWRIVRAGTEEHAATLASRQFGIRHLLGIITAVAVVFAMAQFAVSELRIVPAQHTTEMWIRLLAMCLAVGMSSLLLVLPCVWAALAARHPFWAIVGYGALLFVAVQAILSVMSGDSMWLEVALGLLSFLVTVLGLLFGVLRIAHGCGYTLVTAGMRNRSAHAPGAPVEAEAPADPAPQNPFRAEA